MEAPGMPPDPQSPMQGRAMQLLALCAFQLLVNARMCAGGRGASQAQSLVGLTPDVYVIGIWQPYLKTVNKCENFRLNTTEALFKVWPEYVGNFCCEDKLTPHTIASYVHSEENGRYLNPIRYYDVGIVDAFMPFWSSWRPDRISQKDITNLVYCELTDLEHFYELRYLQVLAKQGLLYSGMPFVLVVEFLVGLVAILQCVLWGLAAPLSSTLPKFWGWDTTWDLIHLCLLGVNGSLLMEAVGHWDPCGWEAMLLYNSAVFYTYLSLLSIVSAVMQQVALWTAVTTDNRLKTTQDNVPKQTQVVDEERSNLVEKEPVVDEGKPDQVEVEDVVDEGKQDQVEREPVDDEGRPHQVERELVVEEERQHRVEKEWQQQRFLSQFAVFVTVSLYCNFVTVYSRNEFVACLLGIIIVAQVCSFAVAFAVLNKAFQVGRSSYPTALLAKSRQTQLAASGTKPEMPVAASETKPEMPVAKPEEAEPDAGRPEITSPAAPMNVHTANGTRK